MPKGQWTQDSHHILEQTGGLRNYNRWLMSHFYSHFGKAIIEIGSGQGTLSKLLPSKSLILLTDIYPDYITKLKSLFTDPVVELDIEKEAPTKLQGKFETAFSSNVFEHINDDLKALRNTHKLLEKGGKLLLFVPARSEIYGNLDKEMGHYRRYTKKDLVTKVKKAGFTVLKIYYANFPGYFTWWARGVLLGKMKAKSGNSRLDSTLAKLFDRFIVPFLYLEKFIHPPFGQSLVLIAEKSGK